jgi:hypothetical protein
MLNNFEKSNSMLLYFLYINYLQKRSTTKLKNIQQPNHLIEEIENKTKSEQTMYINYCLI